MNRSYLEPYNNSKIVHSSSNASISLYNGNSSNKASSHSIVQSASTSNFRSKYLYNSFKL